MGEMHLRLQFHKKLFHDHVYKYITTGEILMTGTLPRSTAGDLNS